MKTIVAIWHEANKGKTETLNYLAALLLATYPTLSIIYSNYTGKGDFRFIVEINGKIIGIESQGDPGYELEKRLYELTNNYNCDIIFCATRTRGKTIKAVDNVASSRGYQTIWTSTYQITHSQSMVNDLKAKQILDLLQQLGLI